MSSGKGGPRARERLAAFMDERRLDLNLTWDEVAHAAGIHRETLRGVRTGRASIRKLTKSGIERALGWRKGSIDQILAGGAPDTESGSSAGQPATVQQHDHTEFPDEIAELVRDEKFMKLYKTLSPERQRDTLEAIIAVKRRGDQRTREDVEAQVEAMIAALQTP